MDSEEKFYPLWYRLDGETAFLIWCSGKVDSVVVDAEKRIMAFASPEELQTYATEQGIPMGPDGPILHDLDWARKWVANPEADGIHCAHALASWNLFLDIWQSVEENRDPFQEAASPARSLYDKLVFGNRIPEVTPEDEDYVPNWSEEEIHVLERVLRSGLEMFQKNLRLL